MGACPSCGAAEPAQNTARIVVSHKALAAAIDDWNARWPAIRAKIRSEFAPRHRWSWWRFTLLVR